MCLHVHGCNVRLTIFFYNEIKKDTVQYFEIEYPTNTLQQISRLSESVWELLKCNHPQRQLSVLTAMTA